MDEQVRLADAPAIRKISEDCENRVFQQNLPLTELELYLQIVSRQDETIMLFLGDKLR
jgi:hypothetical protein